MFKPVLWIRIGFLVVRIQIQLFYLNANSEPDIGSQTNADPSGSGFWSDYKVTKAWILHEKYTS